MSPRLKASMKRTTTWRTSFVEHGFALPGDPLVAAANPWQPATNTGTELLARTSQLRLPIDGTTRIARWSCAKSPKLRSHVVELDLSVTMRPAKWMPIDGQRPTARRPNHLEDLVG